MKKYFTYSVIRLLVFLPAMIGWPLISMATHNKAGEITYKLISSNTIEATLFTYTDTRSMAADRPEVEVFWGDGTSDMVSRSEQVNIGNNIYRNEYTATHSYPASGEYKITFSDPNRVEGINNIPNSVNIQFHVESMVRLDARRGGNNSVQLLRKPVDFAKVGETFIHNPSAWDPDGDSLHFELITPKREEGADVQGYSLPPASNDISLDNETGEFVWDSPTQTGLYDIAMLITEYRGGQKMGSVVRDMHIIVEDPNNNPPEIEPIPDTCVNAGNNPEIFHEVFASDPDDGDEITLDATGGPFETQASPQAEFSPDPARGVNEVSGNFSWDVQCGHIRKRPYQVVFRAEDNNSQRRLHDKESFRIEVIGPKPRNLESEPIGDAVDLEWDEPVCDNAAGYIIYRRPQPSGWEPDSCETGVPPQSDFRAIDTVEGFENTSYRDNDGGEGLVPGIEYCYRVTALYFGEGQQEPAEGIASNEVCQELAKDLPVMTHVDIIETQQNNGIIDLEWSKPVDLDTVQHPGPYRYELYHAEGTFQGGDYEMIEDFPSPDFHGLNDTTFTHEAINTQEEPHNYFVRLIATIDGEDYEVGDSRSASSIWLNAEAGHEQVGLNWEKNHPWLNHTFTVYRLNDTTGDFDSLAQTTSPDYTDTGLTIGEEYCYYVRAYGAYGMDGFSEPFINHSQVICATPEDTVPPCPPEIQADPECERKRTNLHWTLLDEGNPECLERVDSYNIYFTTEPKGEMKHVATKEGAEPMDYTDRRPELENSIAGCYKMTAVNEYGYESEKSNEVCVDNCPEYELPNVFSPTGDKINDIYHPLEGYRFVERVDFRVFNRWGRQVFQTEDPAINWDGTDENTGEPLEPGTYYYKCKIYEKYLDGTESREVQGTINLMR